MTGTVLVWWSWAAGRSSARVSRPGGWPSPHWPAVVTTVRAMDRRPSHRRRLMRSAVRSGRLGVGAGAVQLEPEVSHFAAFTLAAHPRPVAEAIDRHRKGLDIDTHGYMVEHQAELDAAVPDAAAEYLGAAPDEIALTDSTTMGLGLLYGGIAVREDQRVLTTEHDFYATHEALRLRSLRTGATVDRVRLYDEPAVGVGRRDRRPAHRGDHAVHTGGGRDLGPLGNGGPPPDRRDRRLDRRAQQRSGRVGSCVALRRRRARLRCRGRLRPGCRLPRRRDPQVAVRTERHRHHLGAPRRMGRGATDHPTLRRRQLRAVADRQRRVDVAPGAANTPGGYHSFEHRWALAEAFRFHLAIGRDLIAERTHTQATRLKEGLAEVSGVRMVTPMADDLSSGIVCVELAGRNPFEAVEALDRQRISASVTPYREPYVRLGPSIVTTPTRSTQRSRRSPHWPRPRSGTMVTMRRTLYLLRHAKSSWSDEHLDDHDRPLAPRGEEAVARLRQYVEGEGVAPELVLCSSARRTMMTLEGLVPVLPDSTVIAVEDGLYGASSAGLLRRLHDVDDNVSSVMLIGHNPGLEMLASCAHRQRRWRPAAASGREVPDRRVGGPRLHGPLGRPRAVGRHVAGIRRAAGAPRVTDEFTPADPSSSP